MDRYRVAPARPVCLSSAGPGGHLRPAAAGRRSGGAEIGIFTAERYFSAADVVRPHDAAFLRAALPDHHQKPPQLSIAASDAASQSGRTAASSEASWNSCSGLLSGSGHLAAVSRPKGSGGGAGNASGDLFISGGKKNPGSGQRWTLFGRECPCAGRKAVTVDVASEPRSPADARFSPQSAVDKCLESAIFKAKPPSPPRPPPLTEEPAAKMKVMVTPGSRAFPLATNDVLTVAAASNQGAAVPSEAFAAAIGRRSGWFMFPAARFTSSVLDEPPRASLEVFHPIDEDSVMLADPPPALSAAPSRGRDLVRREQPVVDEEAMSDASSDLFDLESFAASSSYPTTYRGGGSRRNSADDGADLPPPYAAALAEPALSECMYATSEASVVWSVATAEGGAFDAASVANFSISAASASGGGGMEEFRFVVPESPAEFAAAVSRSAAARKKSGGFLNSCRCEKAVSVGPTPVRMVKPPPYPAAADDYKKGSGRAARCHPGRVHEPVRT